MDVFFVISGYLITTIILAEMDKGSFSLVHFYERRTRRILPALFLVMAATLPAAYLWLIPADFKDYSHSLVAVSVFASNIAFWLEAGYWDVASELKPLLHTWTLAVEEQYYLLFPLFLMFMWRFKKRWIIGSFGLLALISLGLAQWGAYNKPFATFFLLPTRGWELAIGAAIAFYFLFRKQTMRTLLAHKTLDETLSLLGLLLIGYAVFVFDKNTPFPGLYALVPTIGTGLIILFSSPQTIVGRLLGTKLLVGVGLISYSAYLWHYPLLAFARHRSLTEPGLALLTALALLSFPLAYLSWKYVEQPFRKKAGFSRKTIFTLAFAGSALFIAIGLTGLYSNGLPGRFDKKILRFIPVTTDMCEAEEFAAQNICNLTDKPDQLTFLIGDSHAGAIAAEMQTAFSQQALGLLHIYKGSCPPVKNVYRADKGDTSNLGCYAFNNGLYRYIEARSDIEYVVMLARWTLLMEGTRFNNQQGGVESSEFKPHLDIVKNGQPEYHPEYDHREKIAEQYAASVKTLLDMGKKVVLVYPVPEVGWDVPKYVSRYYAINPERAFQPEVGSTRHDVFKARNRRTYAALDSIGQHPNLYRVYPETFLCNTDVSNRCIVQKDGHALYRDDDHLSNAGAKLLVAQITQVLAN